MRHTDASEAVMGMVITGDLDPNVVNPQTLAKPFDQMLVYIQGNGIDKSVLMSKFGADAILGPMRMAEAVELKEFDWIRVLETTYVRAEAGARLDKLAYKLKNGDEIDESRILEIASMLDSGHVDFVQLSEVAPDTDPWLPTFWTPVDINIGGFPKSGLVVVGAPPGTGKTSLLIKLMVQAAKEGKKVGFFSLEMTLSQIANRFLQVSKLKEKEKELIYASEEVVNVRELIARASRLAATHPDLYYIGIDFADLLVEGEQSEQVMGEIYKSLAVLSKRIGKPVVLLSQLSRRYEGGVPMVTHLRYSGMAEAVASLILLIYNPDSIWANMGGGKVSIPHTAGTSTLIMGKSRYGFKAGTHGAAVSSVGYFPVKWEGGVGWGDWCGDYTPLTGV